MKLVTFELETVIGKIQRIGVLIDEGIIDLYAVYSMYLRESKGIYRWSELAQAILPPDMLKFIENGEIAKQAAGETLNYFAEIGKPRFGKDGTRLLHEIKEVRLLAPVPRPLSIRDGMSFLQHIRNMSGNKDLPPVFHEIPAYYRASTTDVIGTGAPILWPGYTEKLDYELEFAVCIGKCGVNIPAEKAGEYIFGYTVFNDISARDIQQKEMAMMLGPAKGKSFENSKIMGPCLVTADELDAGNLRMTARVNGEVWSEGNSKDMFFSFPQMIAYMSKDDPVFPGEFIGSGTAGFGCGAELKRWLKPGDLVELEVEGIGTLRNRVQRIS